MSRIETDIHPFIQHLPGYFEPSQMAKATAEAKRIIEDPEHPLAEFMEFSKVVTARARSYDGVESGFVNLRLGFKDSHDQTNAALAQHTPEIMQIISQVIKTPTRFGDIAPKGSQPPSFTLNHAPFDGEVTRHKDAGSPLTDNVSCVVSLIGEAEFYVEDGGVVYDLRTAPGDLMFLFSPRNPNDRLYHGADVIGDSERISLGLLAALVPSLVEITPVH